MMVSKVKQISLMIVMSCALIMNVGFAQAETETIETEATEKELSKYEKAVIANEYFSDTEKQQLLDYMRKNPNNMLNKSSEERQAAIDEQIQRQRNYLLELDHQKELFGSRADRNDQVYRIVQTALEMHDQEPLERPDADATPEEKKDYQDKRTAQLMEKKALIERSMQEVQGSIKGTQPSMQSFDHLKDEDGNVDVKALKEELNKRQQETMGAMLQGDQKTACEVILCLSAGQRPDECQQPITDYLTKTIRYGEHGIDWGATLDARSAFLQQCPATQEDDNLSELAEGHARLGDSCNLGLYNKPTRTIYYNALDPLSDKEPAHKQDILSITVVDSAINAACKEYIENEYMDLYLTPFRKYHNEMITMYKSPFNPVFDDPNDSRRPVTESFGKIWDLEKNEFFEFGSWYYEKPLEW